MSSADPHAGDEATRDAAIGAILNEYLDRRAAGEALSETRLLADHPELADELRLHLELLRDLRPVADRIDVLINQGLLTRSADPEYLAELGPYRIQGFVGRGGMGIVLKAFDPHLNRTVALKLLRPELTDDPQALARFTREAKAAAAFQHPNIVTVHAIGQERGVHFLVLEYVDGPTLAHLIRREGPLPEDLARGIFRQLLMSLGAAHAAGLIHRDIKPSNILLAGGEPRLKIADFGLVRVHGAQTQLTLGAAVMGTPDYMSPEQARGSETLDPRTDLYSAGVVLYEMLTGQPPFRADAPTVTLHRILHEEPAFPNGGHAASRTNLARLALRLMEKNPADRLPSATAALQALDADERLVLRGRRRRALRRAGAAAVVAVLGVAAVIWGIQSPPRPSRAPRELVAVQIDRRDTRLVTARSADDDAWVFHRFPAEAGAVTDVALVPATAAHPRLVVAGTRQALHGACVFAFDAAGRPLWQCDLSVPQRWPDCGPPTNWWCTDLIVAELDEEPGPELVVAARDAFEYPSRISIVDPATGDIRTTFYHLGELYHVEVAGDFFGPGRPAILATAVNNKLDGFYEPLPPDREPYTRYDYANVAMVLDPQTMEGVGPPSSVRMVDLPRARPFAYAFLDMPCSPQASYRAGESGAHVSPDPSEVVRLERLSMIAYGAGDERGPWLTATVRYAASGERSPLITLDRNLNLLQVVETSRAYEQCTLEYWRRRWHPLIQNGHELMRTASLRAGQQPVGSFASTLPDLTAVHIDADRPQRLMARYGASEWVLLREFDTGVSCAVVAWPNGAQLPTVVVGLDRSVDGGCVCGLADDGGVLWRTDLISPCRWPDCAPPADWRCAALHCADYDGVPGDEVLVISSDLYEYPTRVSLLDVTDGTVRHSIWHTGHLDQVRLLADFFGVGHPAVVMCGTNNKLDGCYEPQPGDPPALTRYDLVSCIMVLDPRAMRGVAPPGNARVPELPPGSFQAYAFLDLPSSSSAHYWPEGGREPIPPDRRDVATLRIMPDAPAAEDAQSGPWIMLNVENGGVGDDQRTRALLWVDRDLQLRRVVNVSGETIGRTERYWRERWHVIPRPEALPPGPAAESPPADTPGSGAS